MTKPRHRIPDTLTHLMEPIPDLKPYPRNARQGDVEELKRSLEYHGQYRPIVANKRTQEVLAGNHTLKAARALGWTHIAVTWVDVDEDQAARIVLVDNRANDLADYDDQALVELLESLDEDMHGTGYTEDDLVDLLAAINDEDEVDPETGGNEPADGLTSSITINASLDIAQRFRDTPGETHQERLAYLLGAAGL